jgi:RNA polymerase primary sigma factor
MAKVGKPKKAIGVAKPPKTRGLKQPFDRAREEPPLAQPLRRYVDHGWLRDERRIAEFLKGEIPEPDVSWYFQVIEEADLVSAMRRKYKPWTSAEEQVVFLRYNYFRRMAISAALRWTQATDPMERRVSMRELRRWEQKALEIRAIIAAKNLGLVLSMCSRQIKGFGNYDEDLVGEGNAALLRAIDLFDFSFQFKFSTYACRAVIKSVIRHLQKQQKIRGMEGASYTDDEHSGWEPSYVDPKLGHDEEAYRMEKMVEALRDNTAELSSIEQKVLLHRFGFMDLDNKQVTLVKVGERLGLTKERVRQIQNAALVKLRDTLET